VKLKILQNVCCCIKRGSGNNPTAVPYWARRALKPAINVVDQPRHYDQSTKHCDGQRDELFFHNSVLVPQWPDGIRTGFANGEAQIVPKCGNENKDYDFRL